MSTTTRRQAAERWQLEGNSAEAYERYLVPEFFAPWADDLVASATPRRGERVLDVGCGTGIVARRAAPKVGDDGTVVGLDLNEGMLAVARRVSSGVRPAIEWRLGDALEMPFEDGAFDVVLSQQALQFFPERARAFREMHRVLADGGRLALSVLRSTEYHPVYAAFADALERHAGELAGRMMRSPFPSITLDELRAWIADAGFREVHLRLGVRPLRYPSVEELVRREAASSPLAEPLRALSQEARDVLLRELTESLRPYTDDEGVVSPMMTYVATARR